jgi:hypothetical protein
MKLLIATFPATQYPDLLLPSSAFGNHYAREGSGLQEIDSEGAGFPSIIDAEPPSRHTTGTQGFWRPRFIGD